MQNILRILIGSGLLFFSCIANSQAIKTASSYIYDANGNRLVATVIYLGTRSLSEKVPIDKVITNDSVLKADSLTIPKDGWNKPITEPLNNLEINIYPNPLHGMLIIELAGMSNEQKICSGNVISVFDLEGRNINSIHTLTSYNTVDLSSQPNGTYILKINIDGQVKDYKIIKE